MSKQRHLVVPVMLNRVLSNLTMQSSCSRMNPEEYDSSCRQLPIECVGYFCNHVSLSLTCGHNKMVNYTNDALLIDRMKIDSFLSNGAYCSIVVALGRPSKGNLVDSQEMNDVLTCENVSFLVLMIYAEFDCF